MEQPLVNYISVPTPCINYSTIASITHLEISVQKQQQLSAPKSDGERMNDPSGCLDVGILLNFLAFDGMNEHIPDNLAKQCGDST